MGSSGIRKLLHSGHDFVNSQRIGVTQRPTAEWSKSSAHNHGKINVRWIGDDLFFEAAGGFVEHEQDHALLKDITCCVLRVA